MTAVKADLVAEPCQECERELAGDSPDLRLELTYDDEPTVYCEACWQREFRRRASLNRIVGPGGRACRVRPIPVNRGTPDRADPELRGRNHLMSSEPG